MTRKYLSVAGLAALAWASFHVPALAQTATEDGYRTDMEIVFAATEDALAAVSHLTIHSAVPFEPESVIDLILPGAGF